MATEAGTLKRPADTNYIEEGQSAKRAKGSEHSNESPHMLLSVPAIDDHIGGSTLLPALQQLLSVYKVEYWTLMEELRSRRHAYCDSGRHTAGSSGVEEPLSSSKAGAAQAPAASEGSMRQLVQAMRPNGGPAAGADDVVIVGEQHKGPATIQQPGRQQTGEAGPSSPPAAQQQQQPAKYGDERCGYGSRDDEPQPLPLAEVEQLLLQLPPGSDKGVAGPDQLQAWHERFKGAAAAVAGLEQLASAATLQYLDTQGGLACLCGSSGRWVIRRTAVSLGRSSDSKGDVDVDLARLTGAGATAAAAAAGASGGGANMTGAAGGGTAKGVSRLQAQLSLGLDGKWSIRNVGRAPLAVNGAKVARGSQVVLPHLSLLEVGGEPLLFMVNAVAVQRAVARSSHLII